MKWIEQIEKYNPVDEQEKKDKESEIQIAGINAVWES